MLYTNTKGACKLLDRNKVTIWAWRKKGFLGEIRSNGDIYIPLRDIAREMRITQKELLVIADSGGIDIWDMKKGK